MTQHARAIIQDVAPAAIIERAALAAAVAIALMPVERRNSIPILSNLRLTACDGGLRIVGTDLDIESAVIVPGAVDSRFDVTLPAHNLNDFLKKAKASEYVAMSAAGEGAMVDLDFEGLHISLQALPATDFPELAFIPVPEAVERPIPVRVWSYTLPAASLAKALGKVEGCISTEETRFYLNGVYFHHEEPNGVQRYNGHGGTLCFAATDGHRLSRYDLDSPQVDSGMPGVIVPRKTIAILRKMLTAELKAAGKAKIEAAPVTIEITAAKVRFIIGSAVVTSKLIDGTFPDYERCIPTGNDKGIRIDRKALVAGVEQVTVVSAERGRAVKIVMESGRVRLEVSNPDAGTARLDVPAVFYNADPDSNGGPLEESAFIEIGLNSSYLLDALGNVDSDEIEIRLADSGSPVRFHDPEDDRITYVLMPMRV